MRLTEEQFKALTGKSYKGKKKKTTTSGSPDSPRSNVKGWRTIGKQKCYFRSLWEINYACYLEFLKRNKEIRDWVYEPKLFRFPKDDYNAGPFMYKPDFHVTELSKLRRWHEVKGWMNPSSKKKIKRFHKHFPEEGEIFIISSAWFAQARKKNLHKIIPGWETLKSNQVTV